MGKEVGRKVLVKIGDGGGSEVFTTLAGQKDATLTMQAGEIDMSDKASGVWGETVSGDLSMSVQVSGNCNWPDTTGLKRVMDAFVVPEQINAQLILNDTGDYWQAAFAITQCNIAGPKDNPTSYDITLKAAAQPVFTAG
ncbi:hypothetical protein FRZ44_38010 [Hypericibacter terrae]|uniref:Tail protein n=1 Tax=Hypericibacter terrae TaxID=2602015 RepID=A0A5J6MM20_9PROT|nr:phage tail tube protein [Hypericibacter terrae]QEX18494.1 hypothetical protein FRZ44_38010 [Hypericibacter terrae]